MILGRYKSAFQFNQRIILHIHQTNDEPNFDTTLHIDLPERSLDVSYGLPLAVGWALLVIGAGVIGVRHATRPRNSLTLEDEFAPLAPLRIRSKGSKRITASLHRKRLAHDRFEEGEMWLRGVL